MEDQNIKEIEKVEKDTPNKDISLSNVDAVQLPSHNLDAIGSDDHNSEPYDYVDNKQLGDDIKFQLIMVNEKAICHRMRILVRLESHIKFNLGGLTGRDNLLQGIILMSMLS